MGRSRLGIVIPALNEAASIAAVISAAGRFGMPIVVDDGSTDATSAVAVAAGADVVRHERNRGYDAALGSGFARAAALQLENVVTMDADGQHNPLLLQQFIDELDKGVDIVLGVRDRRQRFAEHAFAWIAQRLWSIKDPLCGMKGYDMDVYRQLGHFDSYRSIGTELAIFAARRGLEITQIPVKTAERIGAPRFGRRIVGNLRILRALFLGICRSSKHARSQ